MRRIAVDLLIWYALVAVFLWLYVGVYSRPGSAVVPHLLVMAVPLAGLVLARLVLSRLIAHPALRCALASVATFGVLGLVVVYYLCVLVGLRFWGGVVAESVIPTFFAQAPELVDALGMPRALVYGVVAVVAAGLFTGCWAYLRRFDWTADIQASNAILITCITTGWVVLGVGIYDFLNAPWVAQSEPVSLSLFPEAGTRDIEGHHVDPQTARALDRREDAARAAYVPIDTATRRNLILIVVDALRPDHMGVLGYPRDTTPNLSRLERTTDMRKAIAHASCADTICGLMSLADSRFPREFSFRAFGLAEVLRRNGYRVHMILSGDHTHFYSMKSYYGAMDDFYDGNSAHGYFLNDDRLVVDRLAGMPAWDGVPTMFQFHLMSVHTLGLHDDQGSFQPAKRYLPTAGRDFSAPAVHSDSAVNFYDNGVVQADAVISRLLDSLRDKGYLSNALVVITADHGESLGEHGLFGHANSVREEVLRVPLLLVSYGYRPPIELDPSLPALQVDIAPTILAEFGIPQPRTWVGRPLQHPPGLPVSYFEEHVFSGLIDIRDPHNVWKYWTDSQTEHAFNLSTDPQETRDLIATIPSAVRREWRVQAALGVPSAAAQSGRLASDSLRHSWTLPGALSSSSDTETTGCTAAACSKIRANSTN